MHAPPGLLHFLAPWKELYSNVTAVDTGVVFVHIAGIAIGGGTALFTDRATLRVSDPAGANGASALAGLAASHRIVVGALVVMLLSGIAMATADLQTFLSSPIFAIKLSLVVLLVLNGSGLIHTERLLTDPQLDAARSVSLWKRLRRFARASMTLWLATILAGTALANMT